MAAMGRIDVLADDRGLQACFTAAAIKSDWAQEFIAKHQLVTLDDYVYLTPSDTWEKGVENLVKEVPALQGNPIIVARFRSAYEMGREALRQAAVPATKVTDPDELLPEGTLRSLNSDWQKRYNFTLEANLEPSEQLRSRLHREFKKQQMTVIEARKVRSVIALHTPKIHESVSVGAGVHLEFDRDQGISIRSAVDYYWQLRILAYGWAWAGNYVMQYDGGAHRMMELSQAVAYPDQALRDCMEYGGGSMAWLQRNDLLTRGKMATYVGRGMPAGAALKRSLQETHLEWRSPAAPPPAPPLATSAKRPPENDREGTGPRKRQLKADQFATISMVKGGKKLCKAYNDGRGCSKPGCPDMHVCDVKLASGKPCLSKQHTRLQHE